MIHEAQTMADRASSPAGTETDQTAPSALANVSRRAMLGGMGALVLALSWRDPARAEDKKDEPKKYGADAMPHGWQDDPKVFVAIAADGTVTVTCHRSEMGQGVRTSVALVVADELDADHERRRDLGHRHAHAREARDRRIQSLLEELLRAVRDHDAAHDEAWHVINDNRDVLDRLVLDLLERETLNSKELATLFEAVVKRPLRPTWLSSEHPLTSDRPPVLTDAERVALNGSAPHVGAEVKAGDPQTQAAIDQAFGAGRSAVDVPPVLPKGLSPETADLVLTAARDAGEISASQAAEAVGLSRVTARRYLEHFVDTGAAEVRLQYGGTGRPERRYRVGGRTR